MTIRRERKNKSEMRCVRECEKDPRMALGWREGSVFLRNTGIACYGFLPQQTCRRVEVSADAVVDMVE